MRWTDGDQRLVHATDEPTAVVRQLLDEHPTGIDDLEVRWPSLEDTYIELGGAHAAAAAARPPVALVAEVS